MIALVPKKDFHGDPTASYVTFQRLYDLEALPDAMTKTQFLDYLTEALHTTVQELLSSLAMYEITQISEEITVERIHRMPQPIYDDYEKNAEGDIVGVGDITGYTKAKIGTFIQLLASRKSDQ